MLHLVCRLLLEKNFFNDTATTEIYTLSLHDALPISTWMIARDGAWHGDDDGVVDGGWASLTARQAAARASAADKLNYEFRRLEAAGGYEGGGDELRE